MSTPLPFTLTWIHAGDVVESADIHGCAQTFYAISNCGAPGQTLFCIPCNRTLANLGNLEMHVERGGEHCIALWCSRHSRYELPSAEHLAELRRLAEPPPTPAPSPELAL